MKWAVPKKKEKWVEDMEFPRVLKKYHSIEEILKKYQVNFPGVNHQISRGDQEKI